MHLVMANNKNAKPRKWGLYTYGGLGYTAYDSEVFSIFSVNSAKLNADKKYLHGYISKKEDRNKYKTFDVQYTAGLGVKYKLNDMIDLSLDYCVHFVNSDKFDATVDLINPAAQNISNTLLIAANKFATGNNDKFGLIGVKVGYKIGSNNPANYNIEWNDPQEMILKKVDADAAKLKSLLNDSDKDGVSDAFDKEPNTPSGVKVDGSGMALDIDYDGVPDFKDDELYSAKGSTVNETGVASDSDGDGVADVKDMEPNSASNALVNFRGVTIGKRDETTTTTTTTNTTSQTFIFPSIYFDLNATVVKSIYHDQLADVARILIKYPNLKISIFGNADQRGNDMFNENLGKSRAEAVGNYLKNNFKIDASRIIAVNSYGKSKPISNLHAPNRRVDILSNEQF
jgi:outer membrane protein OmpA-like peptidoglycan-associated protein